MPSRHHLTASCVLLAMASSAPAHAAQHCVICDAPSATYLCEAQNGPGILAANGGQLACITELAKRGGHDSCSVIRQAASQCDGLAPTVLFPGTSDAEFEAAVPPPSEPVPPPPVETTAKPPPPVSQDGAATSATETFTADDEERDLQDPLAKTEKAKGPPKTVAEMADRAYDSSKKGLDNAGKAVGDTAKAAGKAVSETAQKTGKQIGKAGKAVGDGAKKAWNCLTSLFSDC